MSIETGRSDSNQIIRGWINDFKLADIKNLMESLDEWTYRIRMVTWKRWKQVRTRRAAVDKESAWIWANTNLPGVQA